ncbi:hypothetical protein PTUN_b0030 [Pseudoalteromonas tunicata]|nr:hypothetical protein PTUN_b0030 [Pseudoalteromonas tunicata]
MLLVRNRLKKLFYYQLFNKCCGFTGYFNDPANYLVKI